MEPGQQAPEDPDAADAVISVRRPEILLSQAVPRHWYAGEPFPTHFLDALSSTFPFGEAFFVRSVSYYRDQIDDPVLTEQIRGFAGQEGQHSRLHDDHLALLLGHGYDMLASRNRLFDRFLRWQNRRQPRVSLAATAAIEHLTAILARQVLSDPDRFTGEMHPEMARLWRWHALEEAEHKSVAFDVLMGVAPGLLRRRVVMALVTLELAFEVVLRSSYMLYKDGVFFRRQTWSQAWPFLFGPRGLLRGIGADYRAWYGRDFHPDSIDDRALIETHGPLVAAEIRH